MPKAVFALTPRVLELGFSYLSSVSLPEIAQPHLEQLVSEVHESASVSVLASTSTSTSTAASSRRR